MSPMNSMQSPSSSRVLRRNLCQSLTHTQFSWQAARGAGMSPFRRHLSCLYATHCAGHAQHSLQQEERVCTPLAANGPPLNGRRMPLSLPNHQLVPHCNALPSILTPCLLHRHLQCRIDPPTTLLPGRLRATAFPYATPLLLTSLLAPHPLSLILMLAKP